MKKGVRDARRGSSPVQTAPTWGLFYRSSAATPLPELELPRSETPETARVSGLSARVGVLGDSFLSSIGPIPEGCAVAAPRDSGGVAVVLFPRGRRANPSVTAELYGDGPELGEVRFYGDSLARTAPFPEDRAGIHALASCIRAWLGWDG